MTDPLAGTLDGLRSRLPVPTASEQPVTPDTAAVEPPERADALAHASSNAVPETSNELTSKPTGAVTGAGAGAGAKTELKTQGSEAAAATKPARWLAAATEPSSWRGQRLLTCLMLLISLAMAGPPMLLELGRPDVTTEQEARSITIARETQQRWHRLGDIYMPLAVDPLVPVYNGTKLWREPPGPVWSTMAVLSIVNRSGDFHSPQSLILASRVASVAMALLAIASVFWAAQSLGGVTAATIAALVCAATPLFLHQSRSATPAIHLTAWVSLSIAAALWAARPLRPSPSLWRQAAGWSLCGIAWAMAIFCGGPATLAAVALPVTLMLALCPQRIGHLLGLLAAAILGLLLVVPWAVYVQSNDPDAMRILFTEWSPQQGWPMGSQAWLTGLGQRGWLLGLVTLPWTVWVVAALFQPVSTSSAGARVRLFLGGVWFLSAAAVVLVLPSRAIDRDILPLVPALAVLLGQLFAQYASLAAVGHYAKSWRALRWVYLALVMMVSIGLPTFLITSSLRALQQPIESLADLPAELFLHVGLMVVLLTIWLLGLRWSLRNHPAMTLASWALWVLVLVTVTLFPWTRRQAATNPARAELAAVSELVGQQSLLWLPASDAQPPSPMVLLYTNRLVPQLAVHQLDEALVEHPGLFLLTPLGEHPPAPGMTLAMKLPQSSLTLWRAPVQAPASAPAPTASLTSVRPRSMSLSPAFSSSNSSLQSPRPRPRIPE